MTLQDMVILAEMWIGLSEGQSGSMVETLCLPGNITGRPNDRYYHCKPMSTVPKFNQDTDWAEYLRDAVDHVDFVEIKQEGMQECLSESQEQPAQERAL